MSSSQGWNFSRPKFFEQFKLDIEKDGKSGRTQNLACICDDIYYLYRSQTKTIIKAYLSDIWKSDDIQAPYEEWSLSSPLPFVITHFSVRKSPSASETCLLWGLCGLAVVNFPLHKGSSRMAKVVVLSEKTYIENPQLSIIQAKWHPTTRHNIVLVLNNDNHLRSHDIENPDVVTSIICAGPTNSVPFCIVDEGDSGSGELPIDIDFGPHLTRMDYWSIFILKSSGTVSYFLMKLIGSTSRLLWEDERIVPIYGELEIAFDQPTTLAVSKSFPTIITIGGLGGSLYHSVLLSNDSEDDEIDAESMNLEDKLISGDIILFLKEVVELESDVQLSFMTIIPDPLCHYRYACVHQEGVHLVIINFVSQMMELLQHGSTSNRYDDISSTCRYILCSKDDKDKRVDFTTASFSDSLPQKFITVTINGETLVFDMPKFIQYNSIQIRDMSLLDNSNTPTKLNPVALNATETVTALLAHKFNQPYLSCAPDLSPEKREELILESLRTLQKEYIQKQEQAMKFLTVSVLNLISRVEEMKEPIRELTLSQSVIRAKAEELAEKYEEQSDTQHKLVKRFQAVVSKYHESLPVMSDDERNWARIFQEYKTELPKVREQVDGLVELVRSLKEKPLETIQLDFSDSPRSNIPAMALLDLKREIIDHQKILTELSQSIQEVSGNISV